MQPDNLASSRQGTGNKQRRKTGQTVSPDEIPSDNQAASGVPEGATQGADVGGTEPATRHPNRPEREKLGGNYNGPDKERGRR